MTLPRQVLIVEDDPSIRTLLDAVVRRTSMSAELAADGRVALSLLAKRHFDVILLDLLLPLVNGFEVLRHVKCTAPGLLRRIIVITAAADVTIRGCEELRLVRAFYRKPIEIDELAAEMLACVAENALEAPLPRRTAGTERLQ